MLFKDRKCQNCNSSYDECLEYCPKCHERNVNQPEQVKKSHFRWFNYYVQISFALIAIIGFYVCSFIVGFLSYSLKDNTTLYLLVTNGVSYLILFISLFTILMFNRDGFFKDWAHIKPYLIAILGFAALVGLSYALSAFISIFYQIKPSENESNVIKLVQTYPVLSFIILCFLGPICEEFGYRIGLFSFFNRINRVLAYAITIILFTLAHIDFASADLVNECANIPSYLLGAIILTTAYDIGGAPTSITLHIMNNILSVSLILATGK